MQARSCTPKKGNIQQISRFSLPVWLFFSLSLPLLQILVLGFSSLYPALGHIPRVGICLFYISCTLLGHTLQMQACIIYLSCTLLGLYSLGMAMSNLHFLYLAGTYPWNAGNASFTLSLCVSFTLSLCVIALCMMYVYLYMLVCG